MFIDDFVWLPDIVEKLDAKHRVSQNEAEGVFFNEPKYRYVESGHRPGEDVYSAGGQTDGGRYLIVFFIHKIDNTALILTARDMDMRGAKTIWTKIEILKKAAFRKPALMKRLVTFGTATVWLITGIKHMRSISRCEHHEGDGSNLILISISNWRSRRDRVVSRRRHCSISGLVNAFLQIRPPRFQSHRPNSYTTITRLNSHKG